jgi:hypothetical protein
MTDRRVFGWALTSARVLIGAAAAVLTVLAVGLAVAFPWPTATAQPVRVQATPAPSDTLLVCDGPILALGRVIEQAAQLSVAAAQSVVSGPGAEGATRRTLAAAADGSEPLAFTAVPEGSAPAAYAAAGSGSVEAADLRGFAASACRPPLLESWLVGGATTTGASDLVMLANPGTVAATVQVTVYGASGAQVAPGGADRVVPPGTQIVIPLAGLLPAEASPVVHVAAVGAPVVAALQSSIIRTLLPGGVDVVTPVAGAAPLQVIPGVVVAPEGADAQGGARTIVRVLSPAADAEATVTVRDAAGRAVGDRRSVPLTAGVPSELELSGLTPGGYTVDVEAAAPVVAGVWSATGLGEGADFAWFSAAPPVDSPTVVAVPAGPSPVLTVVNDGADPSTVSLTSPAGQTREVAVEGGAATQIALTESGAYTLDPSRAVRAAVSFSAAGALAGYPVWAADAAAPPITVYP